MNSSHSVCLAHGSGKARCADVCGFYGLIFGTLTAIPVLILSGPAATLAYIISGIPFDLIHGVSNFLLAFLLLPTLRRILARLTRSLNMGTLYFE